MANDASLLIKLLGDKSNLDITFKGAEEAVNKFGKSAVDSIDKTTTSTMRNWRESNRMSGSINGLALSMGGANKTAASLFGVLDNLGDYFERARIRGISFKDAVKNLSSEMSMMVTGGIIAAAAFAFKSLTDYIADMNKKMDVTDKLWSEITIDLYRGKLEKLKTQYDNNAISAEVYITKAKELNELMVNAKYADQLSKATDEYDKLNKTLGPEGNWWNLQKVWVQGIDAMTGNGKTKLTVLSTQVTAINAKIKQEISALNQIIKDSTSDKIDKDLAKAAEKAEKAARAAAEAEKKRARFGSEIDDMILEHRQNTLDQIADYEEEETQESIDRIQGYYNTVASSLANATVSSLTSGIKAWRDWANQVIAEIERVIIKQLILTALTSIFGGAAGGGGILGAIMGALGGGSKAGGFGGAGSPQIQIITADPATTVRFINNAYGNATPKAQTGLYRNVQLGALQDNKR